MRDWFGNPTFWIIVLFFCIGGGIHLAVKKFWPASNVQSYEDSPRMNEPATAHAPSRKTASESSKKIENSPIAEPSEISPGGFQEEQSPSVSDSTKSEVVEAPRIEKGPLLAKDGFKVVESAESVARSSAHQCSFQEFLADGARGKKANVSKSEWSDLISVFHEAKAKLKNWAKANLKVLDKKSLEAMNAMVEKVKIQRPSDELEPDLNWRGIGVRTQTASLGPMIHLGAGFVSLLKKDRVRARFELVRLLAQSWAPCELEAQGMNASIWGPLLQCMDLDVSSDCKVASTANKAWAISSALAAHIAPPNCAIPAFEDPAMHACLATIPVAKELKVARNE